MPKWYKTGSPTLWLRSRNRLEELFRWIPKIHDVLEPEIVGVLDANSIYTMLKEKGFKHIFLSDEQYQVTTKESIEKFLALDETDKVKYVPIWHDCDDFSFRLMGQFHRGKWGCLAIGVTWSQTHAFNDVVLAILGESVSKAKLYIIEPQTDEVHLADELKEPYRPFVLVIM